MRTKLSSWLLMCVCVCCGIAQEAPAQGDAAANAPTTVSPCRNKGVRTVAQKKISSQLLCAIYPAEGQAMPQLDRDAEGRILVDIRAKVSEKLLACVAKNGGKVVRQDERYNSVIAYLPLDKIEEVAALSTVRAVRPAAKATTH